MELVMVLLLFGFVAMLIANSRGRSGGHWFLLGCLLGPFALLVAFLPSLKVNPNALSGKTHVPCPECKEPILCEASVCKHCKAKVDEKYRPFGDLTPPKLPMAELGLEKSNGLIFLAIVVAAIAISVISQQ